MPERPSLSRLGYESWAQYLKGMEWTMRRRRYVTGHPLRECWVCGAHTRLSVRHVSYKHPGCEPDSDLAWLCKPCERRAHALMAARDDVGPSLRTTLAWMRESVRVSGHKRDAIEPVAPGFGSRPEIGRAHARRSILRRLRKSEGSG